MKYREDTPNPIYFRRGGNYSSLTHDIATFEEACGIRRKTTPEFSPNIGDYDFTSEMHSHSEARNCISQLETKNVAGGALSKFNVARDFFSTLTWLGPSFGI